MSEDYGSDFLTLIDEDGKEFELERVDTMELGSQTYMAFLPAEPLGEEDTTAELESEEEYGLILMKVIEEDGEELLSTLDSDEEMEYVYQKFMERLFDADDEGEEE